MKKFIRRLAITTFLFGNIAVGSTMFNTQEASAKYYQTYTSPVYQYWDSPHKYDFYAGNYKKQLPSNIVISNPRNGGALQWTLPKLVISKNGVRIYSSTELFSGMIDYLQFTSTKNGYLHLFCLSGDKNGNINYSLIAMSPSGKSFIKKDFKAKGGVKNIKFISLNKVKFINYKGQQKIHTFNKLKIK